MKKLIFISFIFLAFKGQTQDSLYVEYEYAMVKINYNNWKKIKVYYENGEVEDLLKIYPSTYIVTSNDDSLISKTFFFQEFEMCL